MPTTLVTRMAEAWRKRESPAIRWAWGAFALVVLAFVAHTARYGTTAARVTAGLVMLAATLSLVLGLVLARRQWKNERRVLRRVLFSIDKELGERALRACNVVEETTNDAQLGSAALAKHHYDKLLKRASLAAVGQVAARRATRWRWFSLAALLAFLALLAPEPIRILEGFNVLMARRGEAPLALTYVDLKRVTVKPPSYLRDPVRSAMLGVSARFPSGSTVVVQGKPRYEGRELVLSSGSEEVPFVSDGHGGVTATWTLTESTELRVASRHGKVRIDEPEHLSLQAIRDQSPRVSVEGAPKTVNLKDLEQLDIRYRAEDDHGIRQVDLVISSGKRESRRVLQKLDGEDRSVRGGYSLDAGDEVLKRMFLPVQLAVEAKDDDPITGPKWGKSPTLVVLPPIVGEPEATRFEALTKGRDELVDVLALYADSAATDGLERRKQLDRRRQQKTQALKRFEETLESTFAGLVVPRGLKNFLAGQIRMLERPPRPGASRERQLQDAVLAIDVALQRLATREARSVAVLLADVVEDAAEGAREARETEAKQKGLTRLSHALKLSGYGALQLQKLGVLGADLGSVAEGDLDRVRRAQEKHDLSRAELAARHLAERLRRPNPSFGSSARGGVESGTAGQGPPREEASNSDTQFDELARELEQLAQEHARGVVAVEEALQNARRALDTGRLKEEARRRAHALRQSVAGLPEVGADPGSSRAAAALAREHTQAMAHDLEQLDLARAVESAEQALQSLQEAARKSKATSLADWLDPEELDRARQRVTQDLAWIREELRKQKTAAQQLARESLSKASEQEHSMAQRAGNLAGRGQNDQTPLPEDVLRRLERAETLMRQAARELGEGSADRGLDMQQDAQRLLEQSRTGKTSDPGRNERSRGSNDGGKDLHMGGEVPGPDDEDKAAKFRQRVLRGLGKEREGRLAPAVKRYAEELLR